MFLVPPDAEYLGYIDLHTLAIPVVCMQTIAANLGSMLTPIGNPQNLCLYGKNRMGIVEFLLLMLPYPVVSLLFLVSWAFDHPDWFHRHI